MSIYDINDISLLLSSNTYAGRGIVVGKSVNTNMAVFAYFIMGRSANSRNRIFIKEDNGIKILPFDESKVADPSLIIYSPVRLYENNIIVTNGDQTDTIYDYLTAGKSFNDALSTRTFEPDEPNFTPRISALLELTDNDFSYKMSILKSADPTGSAANRFSFEYAPINGLGHFIHTYNCDGTPIPSFTGEPERVKIPDYIDIFTDEIWNSLNYDNKISLYVRYTDLKTGSYTDRLINKNII